MIGMYATLFDDLKHNEPGALKYYWLEGWDPVPSPADLTEPDASYSWTDLTNLFLNQLEESGWRGVPCFDNAVWVVCQQGNLLALTIYDQKFGTDLASGTFKKYLETWATVMPEWSRPLQRTR